MKRLAILGARGHGQVIADAALASGWDEVVFFDDAWPELTNVGMWTVQGPATGALGESTPLHGAVVGIGDNATRLSKLAELERGSVPLVSVIHPGASVSQFAQVGAGSVVFAGAVVNPFARLGKGCIVNTGASVDHHCELEDGAHISPGAHLGGSVRVGRASWIGIGAAVRNGITIGAGATVGAGAAVVADVPDGATVVGVPAKAINC